MTTRFPGGIGTAARGSTLQNLPITDPTRIYKYFNDFDTYNTGDLLR